MTPQLRDDLETAYTKAATQQANPHHALDEPIEQLDRLYGDIYRAENLRADLIEMAAICLAWASRDEETGHPR